MSDLSGDIEEGKDINWQRFNKLRSLSKSKSYLDLYDMHNFYKFFKNLYGEQPISSKKIEELRKDMSDSSNILGIMWKVALQRF